MFVAAGGFLALIVGFEKNDYGRASDSVLSMRIGLETGLSGDSLELEALYAVKSGLRTEVE